MLLFVASGRRGHGEVDDEERLKGGRGSAC